MTIHIFFKNSYHMLRSESCKRLFRVPSKFVEFIEKFKDRFTHLYIKPGVIPPYPFIHL